MKHLWHRRTATLPARACSDSGLNGAKTLKCHSTVHVWTELASMLRQRVDTFETMAMPWWKWEIYLMVLSQTHVCISIYRFNTRVVHRAGEVSEPGMKKIKYLNSKSERLQRPYSIEMEQWRVSRCGRITSTTVKIEKLNFLWFRLMRDKKGEMEIC